MIDQPNYYQFLNLLNEKNRVCRYSISGVYKYSRANTSEDKTNGDEVKVVVSTECDNCYKYADGLDDGKDRTNTLWMQHMNQCYDTNKCDNTRFNVPALPNPTPGPAPIGITPH